MTRVIETVLDFAPRAARPLWLALANDATDESQVSACNQWLWLTKDEINNLQRKPDATKQKVIPLSRGRHAHVGRLKATRDDLRADPAWTDLDILKITCDEHVTFSRRYFYGQVTENPSPSPSPAESLMTERAADSTPLSLEPEKLLAIPTCAPPGKEAVFATLRTSDNVDGNAKENVEPAASHQSFESAGEAAPSTLRDVEPQLSLLHGGHQVAPAVKLKMITYDEIGGTTLQTNDLSTSSTRAFSDELGSALSCRELQAAPGSVATVTTQCFENHGVERGFYSLMPLHGESLKEQPCDARLCDPSCHSALRAPAQGHGEDFTSDARSCLTPTSEVWLLNENTKSTFGSRERRLSVATFLEVTSGSSLPASSTAPRAKTMTSLCAGPRILTRATSVDASALPRDRGPNSIFFSLPCVNAGLRCPARDLCRGESAPLFAEAIFPSRSNVRLATDPHARSLRLYLLNDEVIRSPRKSSPALDHGEDFSLRSAEPAGENSSERPTNGDDAVIVDPQDLGRNFLVDAQENGQGFCARIAQRNSEREPNAQRAPEREPNAQRSGDHVKFRVPVSKGEHEEIMKHNKLKESSGSTGPPTTAAPDRAGFHGGAAAEDDGEHASRLLPDLAEFVLDLQSNLERSIAEALPSDELIALPDSASPFRSSFAPSSDLSKLAPPSDLPSLPSARALPSATARSQLSGFSKAFDADNDYAVIAAPDMDSLTNKFSCESATSLRSLMGSVVTGEYSHSSCLQLKAPSDSDAAALPLGRGPSKPLTASNGGLRSLPFDRGPCLLLTALRVVTRLLFQVSEVTEPARLRAPCSPAKARQVSLRMMILLSILLLDAPLTGIYLFDACSSTSSAMGHELAGSDRSYAALRARAQWSVRLSSLLIA